MAGSRGVPDAVRWDLFMMLCPMVLARCLSGVCDKLSLAGVRAGVKEETECGEKPQKGPIAQRQSRGLIIPWFLVRVQVGPLPLSARIVLHGFAYVCKPQRFAIAFRRPTRPAC